MRRPADCANADAVVEPVASSNPAAAAEMPLGTFWISGMRVWIKESEREADDCGKHRKPRKGGKRPKRAACLGADAYGNADKVRAEHELAQGQRVGEFRPGQPTPPLNRCAIGQRDAAAATERRHLEELGEKSAA